MARYGVARDAAVTWHGGRLSRHRGSTIDIEAKRVCDRDGVWYPIDGLVVASGALYYERPIGSSRPEERAPDQLFHRQQRWVLPAQAWVVNRFHFFADVPRPIDWYIETELIDANGPRWQIRDGYLDVDVFEGVRYEVEDSAELADGLLQGDITVQEAAAALQALDRLCRALEDLDFSGGALLAKYAPELPPAGPRR